MRVQMGEGVADSRKGLFSTHAATIAKTLKGAHVTLQARSEADVDPALIRKRLEESGGSRYSINKEAPSKPSAPAPVGSSYVPVGRPDIASLTAKAKKEEPVGPVGTSYEPKHNELANIRAAVSAKKEEPIAPVGSAYEPKHNELANIRASLGGQRKEEPVEPVGTAYETKHNELANIRAAQNKAPATSSGGSKPFSSLTRPSAVTAPDQTSTNITSPIEGDEPHLSGVKAFSSRTATPVPTKAADSRERPEAVGTSYTPVSLGRPGKLGNRWNPGGAAQEETSAAPASRNVSSGKMTWSERQAETKRKQEEEDQRTRELSGQAAPKQQVTMPLGPKDDSEDEPEEEEVAAPPARMFDNFLLVYWCAS